MMPYSDSLSYDHVQALKEKAQESAPDNVAMTLYDMESIPSNSKDLQPPFCSVVYGGISPIVSDNNRPNVGSKLRCYLYVVAGLKKEDTHGVEGDGMRLNASKYLDDLRANICDTQAPGGHKWVFGGEGPVELGDCGIGYVQVWETSVSIT